ncbi:uncharacterized protein IWZ02DRAFT_145364 [Phyllosticta citriasiana]|uniref:uncharacterized protein n=1 Tax=Phyllosticta citriasiana TaxID=595635 RepID=UPI0030FDEABE
MRWTFVRRKLLLPLLLRAEDESDIPAVGCVLSALLLVFSPLLFVSPSSFCDRMVCGAPFVALISAVALRLCIWVVGTVSQSVSQSIGPISGLCGQEYADFPLVVLVRE